MPDYDAFISYSHAADGKLAPAVQRGLQRLARPWYQRRSLLIFRDETGLTVSPHLWGSIVEAMDSSSFFVLLASPEAAESAWVAREIEHWLQTKGSEKILPVVTEGEWHWDDSAGDFDHTRSNAVPPALFGVLVDEPRHLDLRWARAGEQTDLRNPRFRDAIVDLAAPMHGKPKEELESDDVREQQRARRLARGGVSVLALLLVVAIVFGVVAFIERKRAVDQARVAKSRELSAESAALTATQPDLALMLAVKAADVDLTPQAITALRQVAPLPQPILQAKAEAFREVIDSGGRVVAIAHVDGSIDGYSLTTGAHLGTLPGRGKSPIFSMAFSADGKTLGSITDAGMLRRWTVGAATAPGVEIGSGKGVQFDPAIDRALVTSDTTAQLIDVATGRAIGPMLATRGRVTVWDGQRTVALWSDTAGSPDAIRATLVDAFSGRTDAVLDHGQDISSVVLSPDGRTALTVGGSVVRSWNVASGSAAGPVMTVPPNGPQSALSGVSSAAFSADGSLVATLSDRARIWDWRKGELLGTLDRPLGSGATTPDVKFGPAPLVSTFYENPHGILASSGTISDWAHDRVVVDASFVEGSTNEPVLRPDGSYVFEERLANGSARFWTGQTGDPLLDGYGTIVGASFDVARRIVALSYGDGEVIVRRLRDGAVLLHTGSLYGDASSNNFVAASLSPDGKTLAVAGDKTVYLWSVATRQDRTLGRGFETLRWSGDSKRLALVSIDAVEVIDAASGRAVGPSASYTMALAGSSEPDAAVSHDGSKVLVGDFTHQAFVADVATGHIVGVKLRGHDDAIGTVAFSSDDRLAATGSDDKTAIVWNTATGQPVATLRGAKDAITHVEFSPDDRLVLAQSRDGATRIYDPASGTLVATIQASSAAPTAELGTGAVPVELLSTFGASDTEVLLVDDGYVSQWPCPACAPVADVLASDRAKIHREFTPAERALYGI